MSQGFLINQFFMRIAERRNLSIPLFQLLQIIFIFGNSNLPVRPEAAVMIHEGFYAMPKFLGSERKRYFGKRPIEAAHTAGIDAGGMPPGRIFFKNDNRFSFSGKMQRG